MTEVGFFFVGCLLVVIVLGLAGSLSWRHFLPFSVGTYLTGLITVECRFLSLIFEVDGVDTPSFLWKLLNQLSFLHPFVFFFCLLHAVPLSCEFT